MFLGLKERIQKNHDVSYAQAGLFQNIGNEFKKNIKVKMTMLRYEIKAIQFTLVFF